MALKNVVVLPAPPGFRCINELNPGFEIGDIVLAWRTSTYSTPNGKGIYTKLEPVTGRGKSTRNCVGVLNPDQTVTIFDGETYATFEEFLKDKQPGKSP